MFHKITLHDFQNQEKLERKLGPITTIVGPSDVGKSTLLRAFRWLCLNDPPGTSNIRHGAKTSSVSLEVVDCPTITRERSKGTNKYHVGKKSFAAFGSGVPEDVSQIVNVSDLNFQGQHDSSFWFSLSPPAVSREINAIVDLEAIDRALVTLRSREKTASTTVQIREDGLARARERVETLSFVPDMVKDLRQLEKLGDRAAKYRRQAHDVGRLITRVRECDDEAGRLSEAVQDGQNVLEKAKAYLKASREVVELKELIENVRGVQEDIQEADQQINQMESDLASKLKGKCPICRSPLQS